MRCSSKSALLRIASAASSGTMPASASVSVAATSTFSHMRNLFSSLQMRPEMGRIWSDENKFRMWLKVEVAATLTLAEAGIVPEEAAEAIRSKADFELQRIHDIEEEVKHDRSEERRVGKECRS